MTINFSHIKISPRQYPVPGIKLKVSPRGALKYFSQIVYNSGQSGIEPFIQFGQFNISLWKHDLRNLLS